MNPKPISPSLHRSTKNPTFHGKILKDLAEKDGLIWHPDLKVLVDIDIIINIIVIIIIHPMGIFLLTKEEFGCLYRPKLRSSSVSLTFP